MKRLGRWTLNALTTLSLLLCLGTAAIWGISFRHPLSLDFVWRGELRSAHLKRGGVGLDNALETAANRARFALLGRAYERNRIRKKMDEDQTAGYRLEAVEAWRSGNANALNQLYPLYQRAEADLPLARSLDAKYGQALLALKAKTNPWGRAWQWPLPATTVTLAAYWTVCFAPVKRLRRSLWRKGRRCECCGYDLTGNVSGVCPECGTAIVKGRS